MNYGDFVLFLLSLLTKKSETYPDTIMDYQ